MAQTFPFRATCYSFRKLCQFKKRYESPRRQWKHPANLKKNVLQNARTNSLQPTCRKYRNDAFSQKHINPKNKYNRKTLRIQSTQLKFCDILHLHLLCCLCLDTPSYVIAYMCTCIIQNTVHETCAFVMKYYTTHSRSTVYHKQACNPRR